MHEWPRQVLEQVCVMKPSASLLGGSWGGGHAGGGGCGDGAGQHPPPHAQPKEDMSAQSKRALSSQWAHVWPLHASVEHAAGSTGCAGGVGTGGRCPCARLVMRECTGGGGEAPAAERRSAAL